MEISPKKKNLSRLFIAVITLVLLIPFIKTLILCTKEFKIARGLFGSESVGLDNFTRLFSITGFNEIMSNTLVAAIVALIIGAVYVYVASLAISNAKNFMIKGCLFTLFCIPALIPADTYSYVLYKIGSNLIRSHGYNLMAEPSSLFMIFTGLVDAFRLSGLVLIFSLFIKQDTAKESLKCMLLFVAIKLITFFTTDLQTALALKNSANYASTINLSTYTYEIGLINGDYSFSSAFSVYRVMLQLIPSIIACVVMIFTFKNKPAVKAPKAGFVAFSGFGILPLAILAFVLIYAGSLLNLYILEYEFEPIILSILCSLLYTIGSALLVTAVAWGLSMLSRNSGAVGVVCLTILCLTADNLIGNYLFVIRSLKAMNTAFGVFLYNLKLVPLVTIIFTFAARDERNIKKDAAILIIGFFVLFAYFLGDYMGPIVTLRDSDKYSFPMFLRYMRDTISVGAIPMGNVNADELRSIEELKETTVHLSTAPYILIPILLGFGGAVLGALLTKIKKPAPALVSANAKPKQRPVNARPTQQAPRPTVTVPQAPRSVAPQPSTVPVQAAVPSDDKPKNNNPSDIQKLKEYKELLDSGILTQEEFEAKKKQILGL